MSDDLKTGRGVHVVREKTSKRGRHFGLPPANGKSFYTRSTLARFKLESFVRNRCLDDKGSESMFIS